MASYTKTQLHGAGTPIEAINSNSTFTLTNAGSGSSYFTMETVKTDGNFVYNSSSPKNAVGTYSTFTKISEDTLVTSSYVASVVVPPGGGSFKFNPTTNIAAGGSLLRATGETTLVIS